MGLIIIKLQMEICFVKSPLLPESIITPDMARYSPSSTSKGLRFFFNIYLLNLAALGLSCGMQDLRSLLLHGTWDL